MRHVFIELGLKAWVVFQIEINRLKFIERIDQRLGNKATAVGAEVTFRIGESTVINS